MTALLIWSLFGLLLGGCQNLRPVFPTPTPAFVPRAQTGEPTPTVSPTPGPSTTPEASLATARVCTGYAGGLLNVRACPGTECAVRFILDESMKVVPAGERVRVGENIWIRLVNPIQGWVNGRYLCREGENP